MKPRKIGVSTSVGFNNHSALLHGSMTAVLHVAARLAQFTKPGAIGCGCLWVLNLTKYRHIADIPKNI